MVSLPGSAAPSVVGTLVGVVLLFDPSGSDGMKNGGASNDNVDLNSRSRLLRLWMLACCCRCLSLSLDLALWIRSVTKIIIIKTSIFAS